MPNLRLFLVILILSLLAAACSFGGVATEEPVATLSPGPSTDVVGPTPTLGPSRVLFVVRDQSVGSQTEFLRSEFQRLASGSGYSFEDQTDLNAEVLDGSVRAVILIGSMEGVGDLAAQHPQVGFILVGYDSPVEAGNVYPLSSAQLGRDQIAFLAGYMAAVATFDWRIGAVASGDAAGGQELQAFIAGVRYFCGWCRPVYPPYYEYPQTTSASQANASSGAAVASSLRELGVETVFVPSDLATPEFLTALADAGMAIISSAEPVAGIESQWLATVQVDYTSLLQAIWDAILAGEPAPSSRLALAISHLNPDRISDGRAELVRQVADELQSGFITTGISDVE